MNRKSDLLDVFRSASSSKPAKGAASPRAARGPGAPIVLARRQVLILASGGVLLVVLAFVAGIGIGRGGRRSPSDTAPGLARGVVSWRLVGAAIPRVGGPGAEDLRAKVQAEFERRWPQMVGHYRIDDVPAPPGKPAKFRLTIFGFPSREAAEMAGVDLAGWFVDAYVPFEYARAEAEK